MDKATKILCVCQRGNVRSVGTRRRLNKPRGFENVIAIGAENTGKETLQMLCDWADIILVAEPRYADLLPDKSKVSQDFTIGPDTFGNPINSELQKIIGEQLDGIGLKR